ncbi:MAG: hypothetical protein OXF41_14275 [bacterium]|nr:hypothetical protein [bacterium]
MNSVRIYLNLHDRATWWAEDDSGFTGGADQLSDLIDKIHEWAGCEGVLEDLAIRLVSDPPEAPPANRFPVTGFYRPGSAGTRGVISVGPALIPV